MSEYRWKLEALDPSGTRVGGVCELPDIGAGNLT